MCEVARVSGGTCLKLLLGAFSAEAERALVTAAVSSAGGINAAAVTRKTVGLGGFSHAFAPAALVGVTGFCTLGCEMGEF